MSKTSRSATRLLGVIVAALAAIALLAAPAAAHVTISPGEGTPGEFMTATVRVPHGCEGSPTTGIRIRIPDAITSVTPERNPLWEVKTEVVKLTEPRQDAHGNTITERDGEVVFTAKEPLPDGISDSFTLTFQIPADATGSLTFPVIQTCEAGETAWTEVAEDGTSEPENPAPTITIAAASDQTTQTETAGTTSSNAWGPVGAAAGIAGLVLGGVALVRSRKRA